MDTCIFGSVQTRYLKTYTRSTPCTLRLHSNDTQKLAGSYHAVNPRWGRVCTKIRKTTSLA